MEALSKAYVYLCLGFTFLFFSFFVFFSCCPVFALPAKFTTLFPISNLKSKGKTLSSEDDRTSGEKCRASSWVFQTKTSAFPHSSHTRSDTTGVKLLVYIYLNIFDILWMKFAVHVRFILPIVFETNWEGAVTLRNERNSKLAHFRGKMTKNL